jgi:hypothetical protein
VNDTEQAEQRASGSVPNAFRNALFWRWAPAMPTGLPSSFVTVLYALAAAADPAGKVKFRDGKAIRIKDIAAAAKVDEKDCRRYINAAIAAGVVGVEGEQRPGRQLSARSTAPAGRHARLLLGCRTTTTRTGA